MFKSFVCRGEISAELSSKIDSIDHFVGVLQLPLTPVMVQARQIRILDEGAIFKATVKHHRDGFVTTISRDIAEGLIDGNQAEYVDQELLVQSMSSYLEDTDVIANEAEFKKASESGETTVAVAFISPNRSTRSICRNIVSGCQNMDNLIEQCEGAIADGNLFLIED